MKNNTANEPVHAAIGILIAHGNLHLSLEQQEELGEIFHQLENLFHIQLV